MGIEEVKVKVSQTTQSQAAREIATQQALKEYADIEKARMDKEREARIRSKWLGYREAQDDIALRAILHQFDNPDRSLEAYRYWLKTYSALADHGRGGLPFLGKLAVGETLIDLWPILPHDTEDQNKNARKEFTVSEHGKTEQKAWTVNPNSPLYREVLENLTKAPCTIKVVRTGIGAQDTRYTVVYVGQLGAPKP